MTVPGTTIEFELRFGYKDAKGRILKKGVLRLPTQKDLTIVFKQAGDIVDPRYIETLMLSRMLVELEDLPLASINPQDVIEKLMLWDIELLNRAYLRLLNDDTNAPHVECPACSHRFAVAPEATFRTPGSRA